MKTLYIIGNGFDLFHGLPTSYLDYAKWLEETDNGVLNEINETFGECDSEWWSDFEQNLASVDTVSYASEIVNENSPDYSSDDYSDGDLYGAECEVESKLSEMYSDIQKSFVDWIRQINLSECHRKLNIESDDAVFLSFNYTSTLEYVYQIDGSKVLHIHGQASKGDNLILGHGKDYEQLEKENPAPQGEYVDFSENQAWEGMLEGIAKKKKPTGEIIAKYKTFFEKLSDIEVIIVLGLSFSKVDLPYLNKICRSVDTATVRWISSAYDGQTCENQKKFYRANGIHNYTIINDILEIEECQLNH